MLDTTRRDVARQANDTRLQGFRELVIVGKQ
jgi:hypothetical protein